MKTTRRALLQMLIVAPFAAAIGREVVTTPAAERYWDFENGSRISFGKYSDLKFIQWHGGIPKASPFTTPGTLLIEATPESAKEERNED